MHYFIVERQEVVTHRWLVKADTRETAEMGPLTKQNIGAVHRGLGPPRAVSSYGHFSGAMRYALEGVNEFAVQTDEGFPAQVTDEDLTIEALEEEFHEKYEEE